MPKIFIYDSKHEQVNTASMFVMESEDPVIVFNNRLST